MTPKHKLAESNVPVIGGVIAAIGASLCRVGPFVLLTLGISGAWIGNLTLLEPYRPFFIVIVLLLSVGLAGRFIDQSRPVRRAPPAPYRKHGNGGRLLSGPRQSSR